MTDTELIEGLVALKQGFTWRPTQPGSDRGEITTPHSFFSDNEYKGTFREAAAQLLKEPPPEDV